MNGFGAEAERGALRDGGAEQVARREVHDALAGAQAQRLRSLSASRRSEEDEPHVGYPLETRPPPMKPS